MQQGHYVEVLVIEKALLYYIKLSITNIEVVITFIFQKEGYVLGQDHDLINWILNLGHEIFKYELSLLSFIIIKHFYQFTFL